MGLILFTLTMPNVGSWNGKWSGEGGFYGKIKNLPNDKIKKILEIGNYTYRWDDGWSVNIKVEKISGTERRGYERKIDGFVGYDWMVDSIINHGKIIVEINGTPTCGGNK